MTLLTARPAARGSDPADTARCRRAGGLAGAARARPPITGCSARSSTRIAPHTEADPVAILTQLLVAFGAAVGRGAWFQVEATRHHPNEFMLLVGDSARARKGSSWDHVRRLIADARPVARASGS